MLDLIYGTIVMNMQKWHFLFSYYSTYTCTSTYTYVLTRKTNNEVST